MASVSHLDSSALRTLGRLAWALASLVALTAGGPAQAASSDAPPPTLVPEGALAPRELPRPPGVSDRLFRPGSSWDVSAGLSAALDSALVRQVHLTTTLQQHPADWLGLGADGLLEVPLVSGITGLGQRVRDGLPPRVDPISGNGLPGDEIRGVSQLQAALLGAVRVSPLYGKLTVLGETPVRFQLYGLAGAGAALLKRESINLCAVQGSGACPTSSYLRTSSLRPAAELGAGLRLFLNSRASIQTELRGFVFPETWRRDVRLDDPASGVPTTSLGHAVILGGGLTWVL